MEPIRRSWSVLAFVALCSSLSAQDLEQALVQEVELDSAMITRTAAFDSLNWQLRLDHVSVDTTVVLSDSILYSILMFGDHHGVNALYYLMSYDRMNDRVMDIAFLHDAPEIDQSMQEFEWTTHHILTRNEVLTTTRRCPMDEDPERCTTIQSRSYVISRTGAVDIGPLLEEK